MMHGLNTYNYGARQYDPTLGRWDRIDPMCEKYYSVSPYAYCHNNPVMLVNFICVNMPFSIKEKIEMLSMASLEDRIYKILKTEDRDRQLQQIGEADLQVRDIGGQAVGQAAQLAQQSIKKVEVLEYPELGMEAVWMMEVKNMPAFVLVDDKGNNFFSQFEQQHRCASCPAGH